MDFFTLSSIGLALAFAILIIVLANRSPRFTDNQSGVQGMLWALIAINFALGALALANALLSAGNMLPNEGAAQVPLPAGFLSFALSALVLMIGALSIRSPGFRAQFHAALGRSAGYDPGSLVHTTALILILLLISLNLITFFLSGGISGMAEAIAADGIALPEVLFQQVLWIIGALFGVGIFIRRSPAEALTRLGLRIPTLNDVFAGVLVAAFGYLLAILIGAVWVSLSSPELFAEQTAASQQISAAIGSLPLAFGIAAAVAIGEEIFFRGAFQPVFGNLLTSIFFAIIHTQYTLTPATAIIFIVSLLFGWLRQRHSTTSAVIAHFCYNFIQLALAVLASSALNGISR
jgi:membrane protease YdiL (CAAX protease family)